MHIPELVDCTDGWLAVPTTVWAETIQCPKEKADAKEEEKNIEQPKLEGLKGDAQPSSISNFQKLVRDQNCLAGPQIYSVPTVVDPNIVL